MPNRWITFVKKWSSENNVSYGCALSKPEMKAEYNKLYPKVVKTKGVAKLEESRPPTDVKSKVTYPNLTIRIPSPRENIQEMDDEPPRSKKGRPTKYMTQDEKYKAKLESNKQKRREKAAAKKVRGGMMKAPVTLQLTKKDASSTAPQAPLDIKNDRIPTNTIVGRLMTGEEKEKMIKALREIKGKAYTTTDYSHHVPKTKKKVTGGMIPQKKQKKRENIEFDIQEMDDQPPAPPAKQKKRKKQENIEFDIQEMDDQPPAPAPPVPPAKKVFADPNLMAMIESFKPKLSAGQWSDIKDVFEGFEYYSDNVYKIQNEIGRSLSKGRKELLENATNAIHDTKEQWRQYIMDTYGIRSDVFDNIRFEDGNLDMLEEIVQYDSDNEPVSYSKDDFDDNVKSIKGHLDTLSKDLEQILNHRLVLKKITR
jgi:hypothetical protein